MTEVKHEQFTLTREIAARPATVFAAWAQPELKRQWFVDSDGPEWEEGDYTLDFRVGGMETGRFVLTEGPGAGEHTKRAVYLDIAEDERIIYAYTMAVDGRVHSASLSSVVLEPHQGGTRLTFTEQGTFIGASDGADGRRAGWEALLGALEAYLARARPSDGR